MTAANPFVLEPQEYKRDLEFIRHYVEDCAFYVSTSTGAEYKECYDYIKTNIRPGGRFPLKDPRVRYLERVNYEDRVLKEGTLMGYIRQALDNEDIIAPTFTTYINAHKEPSLLAEFIDENIAVRNKAKHEMFAAEMAQDEVLYNFKYSEQLNAKILNNACSGAHVSESTPLNNKTAHSTLTSNCRSTSGFGNANNEKMLSGNRHYHTPNIVLNNIISIANRTDLAKLEMAMSHYQLKYPTVDDAMACIEYSTMFYWRSTEAFDRFRKLLTAMKPIHRAAFVYVGDLFQIAKLNPGVVRNFLGSLATPVPGDYADPKKVIKSTRGEYAVLAAQMWPEVFRGVEWSKLDAKVDEKKANDPEELARAENDRKRLSLVAATALHIDQVILDHRLFIETFFVTTNVPASLAYFPTSIRRAALTSDTDSTIFTVQDWVQWMTGRMMVDDETNRIAAVMIFLSAETITHILARMSANFGVETRRIHKIAMKNEFKFDIFVPTSVGKHYFAYISCQEGNIFIKYKMEIKGVHLKSSNVPEHVMKMAVTMMREIMETAGAGKKIRLTEKLKFVADLERSVVASIKNGEPTFLRNAEIKTPDSYTKGPEESNYQHYTFWQECFAPVYGDVPVPPYSCYKVSVNLPNQNAIRRWIAGIENPTIRSRLAAWNDRVQKNSLNTIYLPRQVLLSGGIPKEFHSVLELRRSVLDISMVFYLILETLGYYCVNDAITHLVSDFY